MYSVENHHLVFLFISYSFEIQKTHNVKLHVPACVCYNCPSNAFKKEEKKNIKQVFA